MKEVEGSITEGLLLKCFSFGGNEDDLTKVRFSCTKLRVNVIPVEGHANEGFLVSGNLKFEQFSVIVVILDFMVIVLPGFRVVGDCEHNESLNEVLIFHEEETIVFI